MIVKDLRLENGLKTRILALAMAMLWAGPSIAGPAFSCGGFALLGGAQLLCSHVDPDASAQTCTFSWSLLTSEGKVNVVTGSFLLPVGVQNETVYQGSGFNGTLTGPVVLCQGRKGQG